MARIMKCITITEYQENWIKEHPKFCLSEKVQQMINKAIEEKEGG